MNMAYTLSYCPYFLINMSANNPEYTNIPVSITSDALHNRNCYQYLSRVMFPISDYFPKDSPILALLASMPNVYDSSIAYGTLYNDFMQEIENLLKESALMGQEWDDFFISLYVNDNHILQDTYQDIQSIVALKMPSGTPLKEDIKRSLRDHSRSLNLFTPAQTDSLTSRFVDLYGPDYKPSYKTSLATRRYYQYNQNAQPAELRFGTQGQVEHYFSRVNPIFQRFLTAQKRNKEQGITHIYFNNLGLHRKKLTPEVYEGWFESSLTKQLHHLEEEHDNIMVITLPADKGLMSHHDIFHVEPDLNRAQLKALFLDIAMESPRANLYVKDFYISPRARQLIFGTEEEAILSGLIEDSFIKMGLDKTRMLSEAQRQSVWVHFIKFELPSYIIQKIKPDTYNFSCKDAIDRGGVSSAYYNLLSSLKTLAPMTRQEFEQALQAGPAMVKARGMNDHLDIIWNAVDQYMQANADEIKQTNKKWLIEWRDANCPPKRAGELLERRLHECRQSLEHATDEAGKKAYAILQSIYEADRTDPKHHTAYLDAVVSTYAFAIHPDWAQDKKRQIAYEDLILKMEAISAPTANLLELFWVWLKSLFMGQQYPVLDQENQDGNAKPSKIMRDHATTLWTQAEKKKSEGHIETNGTSKKPKLMKRN